MALFFLAISFFAAVPLTFADTMHITYYTIASSDPDSGNLSFGFVNNEVQNALGSDGLPVLNTPAFGCTSDCFSLPSGPTNLTASGEITYWSPSRNRFVTQTGTGVVSLPFSVPSSFFPPNGTGSADGGSNGYQAAVLSGSLIVPPNTSEIASFSIGADDMAFAYLDGHVVCDLGGIHGTLPGSCATATLGPGSHSLEVFFVDINQRQSGLLFGVDPSPISTTPEPATLTLLALGLAAAFAKRRDAI
jgi:hypothetical protein